MPASLTQSQIFARFEAVRAELEAQPWYAAEAWCSSVHPFTLAPPEGITFQVFKPHWFNQERHGVHFESFLAFDAAKQAHSFVTLHLLHTPTVPGTAIKRKLLAQAVDAFKARGQALTQALGFGAYRFRSVELGGQGAVPPVPMPRMMMSAMAADKAAAPVEGGRERVSVSVQGTIALLPK